MEHTTVINPSKGGKPISNNLKAKLKQDIQVQIVLD